MDRAAYLHFRKKQRKPLGPRAVGKTVLVLLGLIGFLVLLLSVNFYVLFRPPRLKILLQDLLTDHIAGNLSFNAVRLDPLHGLRLEGISYTPTPAPGALRSVSGDAVLQFKLSSLIRGRVELGKILLSRLRVVIERDKQEGWHFAPLLKPRDGEPSTEPSTFPAVELENGTLVVKDPVILKPETRVILSGIEVYMRPAGDGRLSLTGGFRDRTFGAVDLLSTVDTRRGFEELKLSAEGFFPTESFREKLAHRIAGYLETIGAKGSLNAELTIRPPHLDDETVPPEQAFDLNDRVTLRLWGNDLELTPPDFPYAFPDVEGSIVMNLESIRLERLRAERGDDTVIEASGELRNYLDPRRMVGKLGVKTESVQVDSWLRRALPPPGQDAWDAFAPSGTLDLAVEIGRTSWEEEWDVRAAVDLRGMNLTYHGFFDPEEKKRKGFPYPLRELVGTIEYRDEVTRLNVQGRTNGGGSALIRGELRGDPSEMAVDLEVVAHEIPFDDELPKALEEKGQFIYNRVNPKGRLSAEARVEKAFGRDAPTRVTVFADIHEASFSYDLFPYPADHAQGSLVIAPGKFQVQNMRCKTGPARFDVDVDILGSGEDTTERIQVIAKNVPFDEKLEKAIRALPSEGMHRVWDDYNPAGGTLDATFLYTRSSPEEKPLIEFQGEIENGRARFVGFPVDLVDVAGRFRVEGPEVHLDRFDARRGASPVWLEGKILAGDRAGDSYLKLGGNRISIDEELMHAVRVSPTLPGETISELDPSGDFDLECDFVADLEQRKLVVDRIAITPYGGAISHTWIPGRLTDLTGSILARDDRLNFNGMRGTLLGGTVTADGGIAFQPTRPPSLELTVQARGLRFDEATEQGTEGNVGALLRKHHPRGKLSTDGLQLKVFPKEDEPARTQLRISGALDLEEMDVEVGIKVKSWTGRLTLDNALISDAGHDFVIHVHKASARLLGYRFDDLSTRIEGIEDYVRLRNVRGKLYEGVIDTTATSFQMHTRPPLDYQGSFRASGIDVRRMFVDQKGSAAEISGKADLEFAINRGEGVGLDAIRGDGQLRVYDAKLFAIPFLTRSISLLPVSTPPVFTSAAAEFKIGDGGFRIDPLEIYSVPVSIRGQGFLTFGGELDLSLATRIAPDLPSIPIIDLPISLINRSLFGIKVRGPIEDPVIRLDNLILNSFGGNRGEVRRLRGLPKRKPMWQKRF